MILLALFNNVYNNGRSYITCEKLVIPTKSNWFNSLHQDAQAGHVVFRLLPQMCVQDAEWSFPPKHCFRELCLQFENLY